MSVTLLVAEKSWEWAVNRVGDKSRAVTNYLMKSLPQKIRDPELRAV